MAPLKEQLALIDDLVQAAERKRKKWLDLYGLAGDEGLEIEDIAERLKAVEVERNGLLVEREEIAARLAQTELTDEDVVTIETFAAKVAVGLEEVSFEHKVRILDLLGVKGVVQMRDGQKKPEVVLSCRLPVGETLLSGNYAGVSFLG